MRIAIVMAALFMVSCTAHEPVPWIDRDWPRVYPVKMPHQDYGWDYSALSTDEQLRPHDRPERIE